MAIGNRTFTSGDIASTAGTTVITKPTGTVSTDILIAVFGNDHNASAVAFDTTAPTGWTAIGSPVLAVVGSTSVKLYAYWAAGDVASVTFTNSSTAKQQGWVCQAFTGCDNTTPIDATGTGNSNTSSATLTTNAVTIATSGARHLIAYAPWLGGTVTATGFTVHTNVASNAQAVLLHNTTDKSTGSTGTVSVANAAGASGQFHGGQPFALRPAGGGGSPATYPAALLMMG